MDLGPSAPDLGLDLNLTWDQTWDLDVDLCLTMWKKYNNLQNSSCAEVVENGQGYPLPAWHSDAGAASGGKPRSSLLPSVLHICCTWSRAFWKTWYDKDFPLNKMSKIKSLECDEDHPCHGLGEHAHFRSFGMAYLTLFRIATGDNWNGIMKDTLREECDDSEVCENPRR